MNMNKISMLRKTLSLVICCAVSVSLVAGYNGSSGSRKATEASAKSLNEIQAEREANEQKIAELENTIASLEGSASDQKAYQENLLDQITLIKDNIALLNSELEALEADIKATEENIGNLDKEIVNQETEIEEKIDIFKERMNEMYVSGNENIASVLIGSSSFYDVMSRIDMANQMAEYDEKLINGLLSDIDQLEKNKSSLQTEKLTLEMKRESQEKRKEEKEEALSELDDKMQYTQQEIDRLERERQIAEGEIADINSIIASLDAEEEEIYETIRRAEEEKKRQEEEERRRQEQLALQQQQSGNSGSSLGTPSVQQPIYTPPVQSSGSFIWPAPGFSYISSYYGPRWISDFHNGIDIGDAGIHGGAAVASQSGTVIAVSSSCTHDYPKSNRREACGCGGNYGNYVLILHDSTFSTMYAHLSSVSVSVGDYVSQGQVVGYIGNTGFSTGAHLHFEVRVNGNTQDPMLYVSR